MEKGWTCRASDNRANIITSGTTAGKRKRSRPKTRWVEDIIALDRNWTTSAQDRTAWSAQMQSQNSVISSDGGLSPAVERKWLKMMATTMLMTMMIA